MLLFLCGQQISVKMSDRSVMLVFIKDHSLFMLSLTALVQVTAMSLLVPKIKACLTCGCLYNAIQ